MAAYLYLLRLRLSLSGVPDLHWRRLRWMDLETDRFQTSQDITVGNSG